MHRYAEKGSGRGRRPERGHEPPQKKGDQQRMRQDRPVMQQPDRQQIDIRHRQEGQGQDDEDRGLSRRRQTDLPDPDLQPVTRIIAHPALPCRRQRRRQRFLNLFMR
ncbi:hypothetical protein [Rubellimicrobium thermophilum]|uniref:hypothetical protein n=1 Tax=Rubellimicrobium thermophilum TaxID=295419 RepID=UPI001B7F7BBC|nr:hypothetical protein [Rubellimicrobium thermophilum]